MNNPAKMLIDLFTTWEDSKGVSNVPDKGTIVDISIQGGSIIKDLSDLLESTDSTDLDLTFYRPKLEVWATIVNRIALQYNVPKEEINDAIFMLRTLSLHFDKITTASTKEDAASVSESLDELTRIITSDPTFPDDLKRYCFEIFEAVRHDLATFEALNEFDLQESIDRLIAATNRLAAYYEPSSSTWENISKVWTKLLKIGTFSKGALEAVDSGNNVLAAITQGS